MSGMCRRLGMSAAAPSCSCSPTACALEMPSPSSCPDTPAQEHVDPIAYAASQVDSIPALMGDIEEGLRKGISVFRDDNGPQMRGLRSYEKLQPALDALLARLETLERALELETQAYVDQSAPEQEAVTAPSSRPDTAPQECPHIKGTVKWGIAASKRWCDKCKKFVQLKIDWDGHP